jgi:PAS domain S-box-containing protein
VLNSTVGIAASAILAIAVLALRLVVFRRNRNRPGSDNLTRILDALPSMVGYWDADLRSRFANNAYVNWLGKDSAAVPGMHIRSFHGQELYERIAHHIEAALRGETVSFEQNSAGTSGELAVHFFAQYVPDIVDGRVRGFYALQSDTTETYEAKLKLQALARENEGLLSTLDQHALVSVADASGRITDVNHAFCAISGYSREELMGRDHRLLSSGTHSPDFWKALWDSIGKGTPWRGEICNRAKDGALYWVDSIIAPFVGENGKIVKHVSITNDITAYKEAQRRVTESEAFLERVEEVSGVGGFLLNPFNNTVRWTRQIYRLLEFDEGSTPTQEMILGLFSPAARAQLQAATTAAQDSGTGYDIEVPMTTAKNRAIWMSMIAKVEYEGGAQVRVIGTVQDITDRRAINRQLQEATAIAQKANRAKSEFLANMSHEIRTPLNAVIGLGYLLDQTTLSDDQRQLLTKIQFAGRALLGVVNNVLDLSKIEAGEMLLEEEPFNLAELVQDLSQMMAPQAYGKGIELTVHTAIDLPRTVKGDASRLRQVLTNLLSNSIKFTQVGQVNMEISVASAGSGAVRLRCEVKDTGIGIEPEALQRLFTPFTQADTSTTRRFGGTGLGLSIARRFVELMGGEIGVVSTPTEGSTFWIEVPLRLTPAVDDTGISNRRRNLQIFIAEAQDETPSGLGAMVRALGWSPQIADSCEPLVELMANDAPEPRPDVLILDVRVLDRDARQIVCDLMLKPTHSECPPIIVVAETARPLVERESLMRATDMLLMRPVTSSALFNAINSSIWKTRGGRERVVQSALFDEQRAQWLAGVRVLVVDDSDINLEVAQRILEKQGAVVRCCADGKAALACVREHHQQIDIVLMDVQMPILDGNETTRRIRGELKLTALPILALTAGALVGERQRSLEAGMNDFVSKPFDPQSLIRKVRRLVEHARGAAIPLVVLEKQAVRSGVGWPLMSSVDPAVLNQTFGREYSLFSSLVTRMLREYASLESPITLMPDDRAARGNLQRLSHKLRGSAGMIGATRIMRLAGAVEGALIEDRPDEVVAGILKQLASALATLRAEAVPFLEALPPREAVSVPAPLIGADEGGVRMDELCGLLDHQDLAAVEAFDALAPFFAATLSSTRFGGLREAIENLDFRLGAHLLREARAQHKLSTAEA